MGACRQRGGGDPPGITGTRTDEGMTMERSTDSAWMLVFACWAVATAATLGALFFSEVMELPPCALCWYQRIFMFPLVLILPGLLEGELPRGAITAAQYGWAGCRRKYC